MNTTIIINAENYVTMELQQKYLLLPAFVQKLLINWRLVQYYVINLLEQNCSIFTIIISLKVIVTRIIGKNEVTDNLN
jgi:hypothetical protein